MDLLWLRLCGGGGGREAVSMICCGFFMAKALLDLQGGRGGEGGT